MKWCDPGAMVRCDGFITNVSVRLAVIVSNVQVLLSIPAFHNCTVIFLNEVAHALSPEVLPLDSILSR